MPTIRQSPLTSWGHELDYSTPFVKMDVEHHLQELLLRLHVLQYWRHLRHMSGSSPKIGTGISSQWATGWRADWRSGYLRLSRFFSVDPSHIKSAGVAVGDMVCRLPPNHGNSKVQTPLATGPPTQSLGACLAHHVWRSIFILVSKFNTKISMVSTHYETCDWLPIRSDGVFSTYVAKHVRLISARSFGRSHLIKLQNKNRYKLVINWCHRSPPRSVFGATSTTTQIFRNTHEAKTPVYVLVEFPIHFLGRLPH